MSRAEEYGIDLSKETLTIKRMVSKFLAENLPVEDEEDSSATDLRDTLDSMFSSSTYADLGRVTELLEDVSPYWASREEADEVNTDEEEGEAADQL